MRIFGQNPLAAKNAFKRKVELGQDSNLIVNNEIHILP